MSRAEKNRGKRDRSARIGNANDIFFRYSLIQYTASLIGILVKYFLLERQVWDLVLLCGVVFAILGQIILYKPMRNTCCYGRFTLAAATVLFTIANLVFDGSMILIVVMPMILLCILYMSKRFLIAMYGAWIVNAVICLVQMLSQGNVTVQNGRDYVIAVSVVVLFGVSAYMVNGSVAFQYANVCGSLKTENRRNKRYYQESIVDSTTELMNRNAYNTYLQEYSGQRLASMSCIYIDVNGLHEYNNTYGHQAGDKMLRIVAATMKECFRSDKQYRIGGDEFVVLTENGDFKAQLEELNRFRTQMQLHHIHIATGLEWRDEDMNIEEMVKIADAKMYQDKERFYKSYPGEREHCTLYKKAVE